MTDTARRSFREKIVEKLGSMSVEGSESAAADTIAEGACGSANTSELSDLVGTFVKDLVSSTELVEWLKKTRKVIKSTQTVSGSDLVKRCN